ncbi:SHOCT domain-containing protein [Methanococcus maripaludis]|uniref:SHOCT domain-containing protein n=2 Tax=Methanococcus maripaludis TaxID=39152 RepID=A6VJD0_METM7|nr:SHOCT domain-containing protein [Methanococcus maripaludis]MBA2862915.1 putative phage infection (PIP) family protein YhgE [Methanococcus maripaludis]
MEEDKIKIELSKYDIDNRILKGMISKLSEITHDNESIKAMFKTKGLYWILLSKRIFIMDPGFIKGTFSDIEIINHSQIERLYYNINRGFFSNSMELSIKLPKEKTRTYSVSGNFDEVEKAIDFLKETMDERKLKKKHRKTKDTTSELNKLEKMADLKDKGIISEEEFENHKKKLLKKL